MNRRLRPLAMGLWPVVAAVSISAAAPQWQGYKTPGIPRLADGSPNLSAPTPKTADGNNDGYVTLTASQFAATVNSYAMCTV